MGSAPSRKDFADLVIRTLRTKGESRTIVFDEEGFMLHFAPETDQHGRFWLHNVYAEYCAAPHDAARTQLLSNLAQSSAMVDGEETWGEVRVSIMPRVRPRAYYEVTLPRMIREMAAEAGTEPKPKAKAALYRPYAADLGVGIAINRPSSIAEVTDLEPWKVSYEEALEVGLANLRRASKDDFAPLGPGVFQSPWRDHYDAERMLLVDKIRALDVKGAPVAMLPNRHTLLVTGEDDAAGLATMVALAEETLLEPRPLTGMAFVLRGDAWEPFEPAGGDGTPAERLARLRARELEQASAEQKDDLQARLEAAGEDLFVASVMGLQPKGAVEGDEAIGLCVWSSGVRSLLPKTPLVAINDMEGDGAQTIVPWAAAAEVVGHRMKRRDDLYPPRWEVETFPTKQEIAEMERLAPPLMPRELQGAVKKPSASPSRASPRSEIGQGEGSAPNASGKGAAVIVVLAVVGAIAMLLAMLFR